MMLKGINQPKREATAPIKLPEPAGAPATPAKPPEPAEASATPVKPPGPAGTPTALAKLQICSEVNAAPARPKGQPGPSASAESQGRRHSFSWRKAAVIILVFMLLLALLAMLWALEHVSFSAPPVLHWSGPLSQLVTVAGEQTTLSLQQAILVPDALEPASSNSAKPGPSAASPAAAPKMGVGADGKWQLLAQLADSGKWQEVADEQQRATYIFYSQKELAKCLPSHYEITFPLLSWHFAANDYYILVASYVELSKHGEAPQQLEFLLVYQPGSFTPLAILLAQQP